MPATQVATAIGSGDMFLAVKGARSGAIKGESQDKAHKGEIDVLGWSWGMQGKPSLGVGTAVGAVAANELKITKKADSATTALMSAVRSNEPIKEAVLTVRKAASGGRPLDYLKITIEQGRITALNIEAGDSGGSAEVVEHVNFSFNKITVEYVPQGNDGLPGGSMMYTDQWGDHQ